MMRMPISFSPLLSKVAVGIATRRKIKIIWFFNGTYPNQELSCRFSGQQDTAHRRIADDLSLKVVEAKKKFWMNVKWNLLWTFTAPESDWIELDMLQHFTSRNSQTKNTYWYTRKLIKLKIICAFYFILFQPILRKNHKYFDHIF